MIYRIPGDVGYLTDRYESNLLPHVASGGTFRGYSPKIMGNVEQSSSAEVSTAFSMVMLFALVGLGGYYWAKGHKKSSKGRESLSQPATPSSTKCKPHNATGKKTPQTRSPPTPKEKVTQHPLYCTTLKGFTREVTCVSVNRSGTRIVVSSSDSSIRVFSIDPECPVASLEKQSYVRGVINADYCTAVDLSVDDAFVFGATGTNKGLFSFSSPPIQRLPRANRISLHIYLYYIYME